MELLDEVYSTVNKYFSILPHTGYKSYAEVDKLLIFTFIEELLYSPLSQYVTDKDYRAIEEALYCLYGTCMIPFPTYKKAVAEIPKRVFDKYRLSESSLLKIIDDPNLKLRVKS